MKDIHAQRDKRGLALDQVGVSELYLPIKVNNGIGKYKLTSVKASLLTDLVSHQRGSHMSRLVELLHYFSDHTLTIKSVNRLLDLVAKKTHAKNVFFEVDFRFFNTKTAPISKIRNFMSYKSSLSAYKKNGKKYQNLKVEVPVFTLCPCSLAMSKIAAHNQRSEVTLIVTPNEEEWFDKFINVIEKCASSELFSVLKRTDEKYVVDKGIKNPQFVEDIVRDIAVRLQKLGYEAFLVSCKSYESIHNHNAFAKIGQNEDKLFYS